MEPQPIEPAPDSEPDLSPGTEIAELVLQLCSLSDRRDAAGAIARYLTGRLDSEAWCVEFKPLTQSDARIVASSGVSEYFLTLYERVGRRRDPVLAAVEEQALPYDNRRLMSDDEWQAQPVYRDVFSLHRLTHVLYVPLLVDGEVVGTLDFGRGTERGPYSADDISSTNQAAVVIGRALEVGADQKCVERERDLFKAALDLSDEAIVLTDSHTAERHLNVAARRLLADLPQRVSLDSLIMNSRERPVGVEVPLDLRSGRAAALLARSTSLAGRVECIVSFFELAEGGGCRLPARFEANLSKRECDVARLAATGLRDGEIAEQLCLSRHTVKQYLKSTYRKLGLRSRVELAAAASGT